jgi:hypothetical protein
VQLAGDIVQPNASSKKRNGLKPIWRFAKAVGYVHENVPIMPLS